MFLGKPSILASESGTFIRHFGHFKRPPSTANVRQFLQKVCKHGRTFGSSMPLWQAHCGQGILFSPAKLSILALQNNRIEPEKLGASHSKVLCSWRSMRWNDFRCSSTCDRLSMIHYCVIIRCVTCIHIRLLWATSGFCSVSKTANHRAFFWLEGVARKGTHMVIFILALLICQSKSQLTWPLTNQECVFTKPAGCKLPRTQACYIQFYVISNKRERGP